MKISRVVGTVNEILQIFIQDSSSLVGAGLTGLAFDTAGLIAYYKRNNQSAWTAISLVTMTAGTYTSGGFVETDAVHAPGWYDFCPPAGVFTSGRSVAINLQGAANMAQLPVEIELTAVNNQDAVRYGLTALPNAAAEAAGGLFTRGTGAGQINQANNGQIDTNSARTGGTTNTGRDIGASVLLSAGSGTGQLDFTSGVVKANLAQILGTALTETGGQIAAAFKKFFNIATPASTMDALTLITTATNLTNAPGAGDLTATMKASVRTAAGLALADYGAIP